MGWLEDQAVAKAETEVDAIVCPKCGASGGKPCRTATGKVAKKDHKERA